MVEFNDLSGLFQPKEFYDSIGIEAFPLKNNVPHDEDLLFSPHLWILDCTKNQEYVFKLRYIAL